MFGLGIWEFVIVVVVGLIVLGPRKLPEVARQIGKLMREFRRASTELRRGLDEIPTDPLDLAARDDATPPKPPSLTEFGKGASALPGTVPQRDDDEQARMDATIGPPIGDAEEAADAAGAAEGGGDDEKKA